MSNEPTEWISAPRRLYQELEMPTIKNIDREIAPILQKTLNALSSCNENRLNAHNLILAPPQRPEGQLTGKAKNSDELELQSHHLEIGIVTTGKMRIWWEGFSTQCEAGAILIIPPRIRYMPHVQNSAAETNNQSVLWLSLREGAIVLHMSSLERNVHHFSNYYSLLEDRVANVTESILHELNTRSERYETVICGSLMCLFAWLQRAPIHRISSVGGMVKDNESSNDRFSQQVQTYLQSNYHRSISLSDVASALGCSKAHLCRKFRLLTGQTPYQFLRDVRLDAAKSLLTSDLPIVRIAEMIGYEDPAYFIKIFSEKTGETPCRYRTRVKNGETID